MQWKEGFNMAEMITVKIDGTDVTVPKGTTILEAARKIGVKIPTINILASPNILNLLFLN